MLKFYFLLSLCFFALFSPQSTADQVYINAKSESGFSVLVPELPVKQITNNGTSTSYQIVIENSQNAYYYVTVGKWGNVRLSAVPDWFMLAPHEKIKLPYANFRGGDRLSFLADGSLNHWQVPTALALDAIYRAAFGGPPPKDVLDLFLDIVGESRYVVAGDKFKLVKDVLAFKENVDKGNVVGAVVNLYDIATNPVMLKQVLKPRLDEKSLSEALDSVRFARSAGAVIHLELLTLIAPKVDVLAFEATYVGSPNTPTPIPVPTPISTPSPPSPPSVIDDAVFVSEGAPYDKASIAAGQTFTKKWTIKNTGNTTWGAGYSWTFDGGDQMGGANVASPTVRPGESWGVVVTLKALTAPRIYRGYWRMNGPRGKFGTRTWVEITVNAADTSAPTVTITSGHPTGAATYNSMQRIEWTISDGEGSGIAGWGAGVGCRPRFQPVHHHQRLAPDTRRDAHASRSYAR